ncbi:MAG TPA: hypothetical protein PKC76_01525 [Saprospiraceae bacterium]|nr:hypothetical protein [Saprospiraceae bacterium]HMP22775.1 hypothetical protein [Saprospiraceae bacterium]
MKNKFWKIIGICTLIATLHLAALPVQAQCPMCKIAAESNLKDGGQAGKGLNAGILYMLATPYVIIGVVGYIWWRNRKREDEIIEQE